LDIVKGNLLTFDAPSGLLEWAIDEWADNIVAISANLRRASLSERAAEAFQSRAGFRREFGFPPLGLPLVALLGVTFLVLSIPGLFTKLERLDIQQRQWRAAIEFLADRARTANRLQDGQGLVSLGEWLTKAAILGILVVLVASLVRCLRAESVHPLAMTIGGLSAGALSLPAVAWVLKVVVVAVRIVSLLRAYLRRFLEWIAPVLAVLAVAVAAVAIVWSLYWLVRAIIDNDLILVVVIATAVAIALAVIYRFGLLDGIIAWMKSVIHAVGAFVERYVAPVLSWIVALVAVLIVVILSLAVLLGSFGEVGRSLFVPTLNARSAGRSPEECINMAVGLGLAFCVMACAAAIDKRFGVQLSTIWKHTPLLRTVPSPVGVYRALLPDEIARWAAPVFANYRPLLDAALMSVTGVAGSFSLIFADNDWDRSRSRMVYPVLAAAAVGVVLIIPVLVVLAWANEATDAGG
jgi:hypothetical protein